MAGTAHGVNSKAPPAASEVADQIRTRWRCHPLVQHREIHQVEAGQRGFEKHVAAMRYFCFLASSTLFAHRRR